MSRDRPDALYAEAQSLHSAIIRRLARAYEADHDKQRDLIQDIHLELWLSLASYDGRCSLRTWVYRVAHNVAASHVGRNKRLAARLVDLEALEADFSSSDARAQAVQRCSAESLLDLIRRLKPLDRQIILLHLEGETAASIAAITGLSASNAATKTHRVKTLLRRAFLEGVVHAAR